MPTDDERREVARRLREAASFYEKMERDVDFYPVESAIGLKPVGETRYAPESVRSLADLIEPSGYECVPGECPLNDRIDRDALLALAEDVDGEADDSGCPEQLAGVFRYIARCIREACG